jgi:hypothetical protein
LPKESLTPSVQGILCYETDERGSMDTMAAEDIEICAICKEASYRWREEVLGAVLFEKIRCF